MSEEIKVGDTVTLKSGGPGMTVEKFVQLAAVPGNSAACVWFDAHNNIQRNTFPLAALEAYE